MKPAALTGALWPSGLYSDSCWVRMFQDGRHPSIHFQRIRRMKKTSGSGAYRRQRKYGSRRCRCAGRRQRYAHWMLHEGELCWRYGSSPVRTESVVSGRPLRFPRPATGRSGGLSNRRCCGLALQSSRDGRYASQIQLPHLRAPFPFRCLRNPRTLAGMRHSRCGLCHVPLSIV